MNITTIAHFAVDACGGDAIADWKPIDNGCFNVVVVAYKSPYKEPAKYYRIIMGGDGSVKSGPKEVRKMTSTMVWYE